VPIHLTVPRMRACLALLAALSLLALAGCGSSNSSSSGGGSSGSASTAASTGAATSASTGATTSSGGSSTSGGGASSTAAGLSSCGPKPGVKATGSPIKIGTIDTHQPGTDFTDGPNMIQAYFDCVNANGGVNGHPLKLYVELDQSQPAQIEGDAKQLIQSDHVVAIDGVFDLLECTLDAKYWAQLGIYELDAGIAPGCWAGPNSAAVNMGPRYSSDGAVQYAIAQEKPDKIVFDQSNVPGTGYIAGGPTALANASHIAIKTETDNVPINNANSVALRLVQDAGPNGSVVLNFTPPEALVILQAAQKLGLEDRVKSWGCSTPCDTDFLAKALGPKWNNKFFVNAEAANADDETSPDMTEYKAILAKYGHSVAGGIGSFSEFGYVLSKFLVDSLNTVKGPYTLKSVNQAIVGIKNAKTGLLCDPWTFGKAPLHIPNHSDYTVTPDNGKMKTVQGCTDISSADPQIAAYLKAAKAAGINTGS
jgi:branched-chain amino acid transport system substrate-binding protein